jgi:hypothetical protein
MDALPVDYLALWPQEERRTTFKSLIKSAEQSSAPIYANMTAVRHTIESRAELQLAVT